MPLYLLIICGKKNVWVHAFHNSAEQNRNSLCEWTGRGSSPEKHPFSFKKLKSVIFILFIFRLWKMSNCTMCSVNLCQRRLYSCGHLLLSWTKGKWWRGLKSVLGLQPVHSFDIEFELIGDTAWSTWKFFFFFPFHVQLCLGRIIALQSLVCWGSCGSQHFPFRPGLPSTHCQHEAEWALMPHQGESFRPLRKSARFRETNTETQRNKVFGSGSVMYSKFTFS